MVTNLEDCFGNYDPSSDDCFYCNICVECFYKRNNKSKKDYWKNICDIKDVQTEKGKKCYGVTLEEEHKLTVEQVLTYYEEELVDALMYIEHIKAKLKGENDG